MGPDELQTIMYPNKNVGTYVKMSNSRWETISSKPIYFPSIWLVVIYYLE